MKKLELARLIDQFSQVCGEGGVRLKGERLNIERYVGAGCNCDGQSLGMDGFSCREFTGSFSNL